jgi:hypothetical protein
VRRKRREGLGKEGRRGEGQDGVEKRKGREGEVERTGKNIYCIQTD